MHIIHRIFGPHSILCMAILGILASFFVSSQVSAIAETRQAKLTTEANLDEVATAWHPYTEIPTPGIPTPSWEIGNTSNPALDGRSLRCAITGGYAYSNLHCYRNLAADQSSNTFMMSLSFYYQPLPASVQALEFMMSKWQGGKRYEWAVQWDNLGTGGAQWRYWDPNQPHPHEWVSLDIAGSLKEKQWHTLQLEGEIRDGEVHYRRLTVDGLTHPMEHIQVAAVNTQDQDKLAVAVQLDGNNSNNTGQLSPYEVFLDRVTLTHVDGTSIDHFVGNQLRGTTLLAFGQSTRKNYPGVNDGPVQVTSARSIPIITSERVIYKVNGINTSFTEMMGLPNSELDNVYWLPWYNNVDLDTQLRFANVSSSSATVHVLIGGVEMTGSPITLAAGASTRKSFLGVNNGPVRITSNVNIVAAERLIYRVNNVNTSFSEMMGLPEKQLDTTYWLPWYNNVDLDTQLRIANVSTSPATIFVTIGGVPMPSFNLPAGGSTRVSYAGINNGPVKIQGTQSIVAAERLIYRANGLATSFTETMALPNNQLNTRFWLPWYNNADLDSQLRIANVSNSSAIVTVTIGGVAMPSFHLPAGTSVRKSYAVNNGPVQIVSTQDIVVAERLIYTVNNIPTSFSEMMGLPNNLLNASYWFPWYNNADLDTQLRFGVP